tara:strand:- start:222 stop:398 length:177 start_codon:yes stop_codon:yes gene_type:complete
MTELERAQEICKNLEQTIRNMTESKVLVSTNHMFTGSRASKSVLRSKLKYVKKKHNIK